MAYEFKLPDIGEGMAEGEIVRWLVKEGDTLAQDQPMVEVMTDKATVEIATPRAGRRARTPVQGGRALPGRAGADRASTPPRSRPRRPRCRARTRRRRR